MKKGFTLAELLIVLGITGIVAAVLLPAVNKLMPDKNKILYLKAYNEITKDINDLISNTSFFAATINSNGTDFDISKTPLLNNEKPVAKNFNKDEFAGSSKLCNLIAYTMNANDNAKCSQTSYPDTPSYTTQNGMRWWIVESKNEINSSEKKASYQTDIYVDIDPSKKSGNCMFGDSNCKQPDIFKFLLAADGTLIPADPLGRKYIETQKSWLKKKYDIDGDVLAKLDDNLLIQDVKESFYTNTTNTDPGSSGSPGDGAGSTQPVDNDFIAACGADFDYGDVWIKYTPYPIADKNFCRDGIYYTCNSSPSKHGPIDIKITLSKPLSYDFTACIGLWKENDNNMFLYRNTCTVKAGSTSCMGEEIDTTTDLNEIYNFDTIYTYDYGTIGVKNYTYYYSTEYLNLAPGFNPNMEVFARSVLELQDNTTHKCVHIKRTD